MRMKQTTATICLCVLLVSMFCVRGDNTLEYVIHMANVGARYPLKPIPDWPVNAGELTPVGMRQLYLLGRQLRQRYVEELHFLNEQYNQLQVTFRSIYSSDKTPCASAYSFAAGLYMPGTGYSLNKFQIDNAVPPTNFTDYSEYQKELGNAALVHHYASVPIMTYTEEPNYPLEAATLCPGVKKLADEYWNGNGTLRSILSANEEEFKKTLYPALKQVIGAKNDITSLDQAMDYRDNYFAAVHFARPLNGDLNPDQRKQLDSLYDLMMYQRLLGERKVAQLVSFGFLNEMAAALHKPKDEIPQAKVKAVMTSYLVNDVNILAVLRLMDYRPEAPVTVPFASSLQIEVYKTESGNYTVTILYNDRKVLWNGVDETVPLDKFKDWIKANTISNFHGECAGITTVEVGSYWMIMTLIAAGIVVLILGVTFFFILRDRQTGDTEETPTTDTPAVNKTLDPSSV